MQNKDILFPEEQEMLIMEILKKSGRVSIAEIASNLNISASTARIRLNSLAEKGMLIRTHGGAILGNVLTSIGEQNTNYLQEKRIVAREACKTIDDGDIIAIGAGTTMLELAKQIHKFNQLTVVTSSVVIAHELIHNSTIDVKICGGSVRPRTGSCFGPTAEEYFRNAYVSKCFFSFDSISIEREFTTLDVDTRTDMALIACAKKHYALSDSSKLKRGPYFEQIGSFEDTDILFIDSKADADSIKALQQAGLKIVLCD